MNVRTARRRGMKPETLAKIILAILLLVLAGLGYYYFVMLPRMGGGVVEEEKMKVGKIEFLYAVYGPGVGDQPYFKRPMGVATDKFQNMYVTDTMTNMVYVFSKSGRYMFSFGGFGVAWPKAGHKATWKPGLFNSPYGIDVDDKGDIYVADSQNQQIQVFDRGGKFKNSFPKPWEKVGKGAGGKGEGIYPTALTIKDGKVYVADAYQILTFSTKGKLLSQFGKPGRQEGRLDRPNGIAVGKDGTIYVSDSNHYRVQAYTPKGKLKWVVGKPPESVFDVDTNNSRDFGLPRGLAVDGRDNIYVVDAFHFAIKIFDKKGEMLGSVGDRGVTPGLFNFPNDIAITSGAVAYIADRANMRVQAVRIPGLFAPEDTAAGPSIPWWLALLLLPLFAVAYFLMRKPRYVAHSDFLTQVVENGDVSEFVGAMKKVYVTTESYNEFGDYVQDERKMSNILRVAKQDPGAVQAYVDNWQVSGSEAELLIAGRRSLMQRILLVRPVFLLEKTDLRNKLEEAGYRTLDHEEFMLQFGTVEASETTA